MTASDVLLAAATHGNELNAAWLLEQWQHNPRFSMTKAWDCSA